MDQLSLIEKNSLKILEQIEYYFDTKDLTEIKGISKDKKCYEITFGDLYPWALNKPEDLYLVANYLQKNGLEFKVVFDLINDLPLQYLDEDHPLEEMIAVAEIEGENIEIIKEKIKYLIYRLKSKKEPEKKVQISYIINIGKFIFNNKEKENVVVEGKQKDVIDSLVQAGENKKISWDEIYDNMKDIIKVTDELLDKREISLAKKSVNGAISEINKKTEKYLEPEKLLIGFKESEYWLQYKIDKDG